MNVPPIVFAQILENKSTVGNSTNSVQEYLPVIKKTDTLLTAQLTTSLAGLSLAAGAFLLNYKPNFQHAESIDTAKKDFMKSFFYLIGCTVSIFMFDFFESTMQEDNLIMNISGLTATADVASKYTLFSLSLSYLLKGGNKIYRSAIGDAPPQDGLTTLQESILSAFDSPKGLSIDEILKKIKEKTPDFVINSKFVKDDLEILKKKKKVIETGTFFKKWERTNL
jgi:hypothetical protein